MTELADFTEAIRLDPIHYAELARLDNDQGRWVCMGPVRPWNPNPDRIST
jgi:hypothetical protein